MNARIVLAAGALLALPAAAQNTPAASGSSVDHAMKDGMDRMNHAMAAAPMTGDADHDFVGMMMPHHQGAIDMARAELKNGHDPELRALAKNIVTAQEKEIATMKTWAAAHPAP